MDERRQQPKEKKALDFLDDSEDEEGTEEEREALAGKKSAQSEQHEQVKQDSNDCPTRQDKLTVEFNMDSDTDVEGEEEEVTSASPVALHTKQKADQPVVTAQFHMDSDTDVDEDDVSDTVTKNVPPSADTKPPHVLSVFQPEDITMDSDTDVDDDALSDPASKAKPVSLQSPQTADSAQSTQQKNFHLDSDTDVDEEEEQGCGVNTTGSKADETPSRLEVKSGGSAVAASHSPHYDSDTDDETTPAPAVSTVKESDKKANLGILSDSDTDTEEAVEHQIPTLRRENTPGFMAPPLQKCSTPVQVSGNKPIDQSTFEVLIE